MCVCSIEIERESGRPTFGVPKRTVELVRVWVCMGEQTRSQLHSYCVFPGQGITHRLTAQAALRLMVGGGAGVCKPVLTAATSPPGHEAQRRW